MNSDFVAKVQFHGRGRWRRRTHTSLSSLLLMNQCLIGRNFGTAFERVWISYRRRGKGRSRRKKERSKSPIVERSHTLYRPLVDTYPFLPVACCEWDELSKERERGSKTQNLSFFFHPTIAVRLSLSPQNTSEEDRFDFSTTKKKLKLQSFTPLRNS